MEFFYKAGQGSRTNPKEKTSGTGPNPFRTFEPCFLLGTGTSAYTMASSGQLCATCSLLALLQLRDLTVAWRGSTDWRRVFLTKPERCQVTLLLHDVHDGDMKLEFSHLYSSKYARQSAGPSAIVKAQHCVHQKEGTPRQRHRDRIQDNITETRLQMERAKIGAESGSEMVRE